MSHSKSRLWWYRGWLWVVLMALVVSPVRAGSSARQAAADTLPGISIYLAADTFDPLAEAPDLPEGLVYDAESAAADGTYLVQLKGPVLERWKQSLEALGAELGPYIPEYAFLVHLDAESKPQVESLEFVRWVGAFHPAYRISPRAAGLDLHSYRITLLPWADLPLVSRLLEGFAHPSGGGERVRQYAANGLSAVLDAEGVQGAARLPGVLWVEPIELNETFNDVAGGILNAPTAWNVAGLDGSGVKVGAADTGLNMAQGDFTGRTETYSYPVQDLTYSSSCATDNVGENDGADDENSGHGTHVTASLAGSGSKSGGTFKGTAYNAAIFFQALEQWTVYTSSCTWDEGFALSGIPEDVGVLLEDAYARGVRVHNNSWGRVAAGAYYDDASNFDKRIFQHPDLLVTVAAGNYGKDLNPADGYTDTGSLSSLAAAKNVLAIGASDSYRSYGGWAAYVWHTVLGSNFAISPTSIDYTSDTPAEMAAFSSRGPTADGRIKPDLVAPGTNIVSARSQAATDIENWGGYVENSYYMYNGGTSMAAPLAAGAAALVREYYIEKLGVLNPSAALIKATLINTAVDIAGYGNLAYEAGQPIPNMHEGWGRIDVGAAVTTGTRQFHDAWSGLTTNAVQTYQFGVTAGKPFKVTLVWTDHEAVPDAAKTLVNNLDLEVTAPDGSTVYRGNDFSGGWSQAGGAADTLNNVENVYIQTPAAGTWTVRVRGFNVPQGPQPYALLVDGNLLAGPSLTSLSPQTGLNDAALNGAVISGSSLAGAISTRLVSDVAVIQGSIQSSTDTQITANYDLTGAAAGVYDLEVVTSTGIDILAEAFIVLDASLPDLQLTLDASQNQYDTGELLEFTLTVKNNSDVPASGVSFSQTFPLGISLGEVAGCDEIPLVGEDGYQCLVGNLDAMEAQTFTITARVDEPTLSNVQVTEAEVSSAETERWLPDNTDQAFFWLDSSLIWLPSLAR